MSIEEYIANAHECATDALVLLESVKRLQDRNLQADMCSRAYGLLKVGSEECQQAHRRIKSVIEQSRAA